MTNAAGQECFNCAGKSRRHSGIYLTQSLPSGLSAPARHHLRDQWVSVCARHTHSETEQNSTEALQVRSSPCCPGGRVHEPRRRYAARASSSGARPGSRPATAGRSAARSVLDRSSAPPLKTHGRVPPWPPRGFCPHASPAPGAQRPTGGRAARHAGTTASGDPRQSCEGW